MIIIDEASRVPDDLYNTVKPIIAASDGDMVLLSTPFGKRGFFWDIWENKTGEGAYRWEKYEVDATEIPWLTSEFLESERAEMGDWWFSQEYMGEFLEAEDSVFSLDDIMAAFDEEVSTMMDDYEAAEAVEVEELVV